MNLIGLDTSTEVLSLALQVDDISYTYTEAAGAVASQRILPQIARLLQQANVTLKAFQGIAFGAGPGAFTGVRVACGVAQGLAFGAQLPVIAVNTLLAVAQASGQDKVIVCQDARMGEVYHAAFERTNADWHEVSAAGVYKPDLVPTLAGEGWVGAGSGWATYDAQLARRYASQLAAKMPDVKPTATAILQLALPQFMTGGGQPASEVRPLYIRNRVALTRNERAQGLRL